METVIYLLHYLVIRSPPAPAPSINAIARPIHCTVIDFIAGVQIHLLGTLILFPKLMMRCLQFQFIFNSDGDVF